MWSTRSIQAKPVQRRAVTALAWKKVGTLSELQAAKFKRIVVPTEEQGKILVQEMAGARCSSAQCQGSPPLCVVFITLLFKCNSIAIMRLGSVSNIALRP
jgi:hypothetical protein